MVAVTLMWSIAGVVTRHLEHAASFEVTFWRSFFTLLSLLVILPALQGRPVANVLVTMAVGPLLTALFARIFIGHHIAPRTWAAIAVAGLGIGWMYGSQMAGLPLAGTLVALWVPLAAAFN